MNNAEIKVAVCQIEPIYLDILRTVEKINYYIGEAGKQKVKLLVFPELILSGYPNWINLNDPNFIKDSMKHWNKYLSASISIKDKLLNDICFCAKENGVNVILGFIEKDELFNNVIYNSSLYINHEGIICGRHRKLTPVKNELLFFKKRNKEDLKVYESNIGRLGIGICAEHFNALYKYSLALQGESIHCALWVNHEKLKHVVDCTAKAISIENGVFTLISCQVTDKSSHDTKCEIDFIGGSGIISPWGEYLVGPVYYEEILLCAEINYNQASNISAIYKTMGRDNREDIFNLRIKE